MTDFSFSKLIAHSPDAIIDEFRDCGLEGWQGLPNIISDQVISCSVVIRFALGIRNIIGRDELAAIFLERLDRFADAVVAAFPFGLCAGEADVLHTFVYKNYGRIMVQYVTGPGAPCVGKDGCGDLIFKAVERPGVYAIAEGRIVRVCDLLASEKAKP